MKRECSTHEIYRLAQEAAEELQIRLKEAIEACKRHREREIQKEVDKQNRSWLRRLFRLYVTPETVSLWTFFEFDIELSPCYLIRNDYSTDLKMVLSILEASVAGRDGDRVILSDYEYRTLLKYSTYGEVRKKREENSDH